MFVFPESSEESTIAHQTIQDNSWRSQPQPQLKGQTTPPRLNIQQGRFYLYLSRVTVCIYCLL